MESHEKCKRMLGTVCEVKCRKAYWWKTTSTDTYSAETEFEESYCKSVIFIRCLCVQWCQSFDEESISGVTDVNPTPVATDSDSSSPLLPASWLWACVLLREVGVNILSAFTYWTYVRMCIFSFFHNLPQQLVSLIWLPKSFDEGNCSCTAEQKLSLKAKFDFQLKLWGPKGSFIFTLFCALCVKPPPFWTQALSQR